MKKYPLLFMSLAGALLLFVAACSHGVPHNLPGTWLAKADKSKLKITDKQFTMESDSPEPEDYFVKGDTIYTSFEGNLPYTKYVIKKLDGHQLTLFTPDSTLVEYVKQ